MSLTEREPKVIKSPRCENCGDMRHRHYSVNFADGPFVSGEVLICPWAIYRERRAARQRQGKFTTAVNKPKTVNKPKSLNRPWP